MSKKIPNNPTRALFVEHQKKHQKVFLQSVVNLLLALDSHDDQTAPDVAWNLGTILHVNDNLTSSAKMWDEANDACREVMWDALGRCISESVNFLDSEISSLQEILRQIHTTDPADLNVIISDPVDVIDPVIDSDDDDDDGNVIIDPPNFLYHATPSVNVDNILSDGIRATNRRNVYLWDSIDKAKEIAERHGDSDITVFQIDTNRFLDDLYGNCLNSHDFQHGDGIQWFTPEVPALFLQVV